LGNNLQILTYLLMVRVFLGDLVFFFLLTRQDDAANDKPTSNRPDGGTNAKDGQTRSRNNEGDCRRHTGMLSWVLPSTSDRATKGPHQGKSSQGTKYL